MNKPLLLAVGALLLTGCAIQPSGITDSGLAPTGIAPGQTLYFVGPDGQLQPDFRDTDRLGTISEAVSLLLAGPGGSGLRTDIAPSSNTLATVRVEDTILVRVPLAPDELGTHGLDQIVCTAQSAHIQAGGSARTEVHVMLTLPNAASEQNRSCPLLR